jgi:glycoprotease/Kae1 family metallohydrolase
VGSLSSSECEPLALSELLGLCAEEDDGGGYGEGAEALARWDRLSLGYTHQKGEEFLRQDICERHYASVDSNVDSNVNANVKANVDANVNANVKANVDANVNANYVNANVNVSAHAYAAAAHRCPAGLDDVLVCAPAEGIWLAMHAMLSPGDHVVCVSPAYQSLFQIAESMGCTVTPWEAELVETTSGGNSNADPTSVLSSSFFRFSVARLRQLVRPGQTKAVIVQFPHNPTGALPTSAEFAHILEICDAAGARCFSDEMYRGLEHDADVRDDGASTTTAAAAAAATPPLPPAAFAASSSSTRHVSLGGLSKTLGLPGLRIGWLATQDQDLMARMEELRDYTTICSSAPSEALASMALRRERRILSANRARVAENLRAVREFVQGSGDDPAGPTGGALEWCEPRGGTFCFPRLRQDLGPRSATEFSRFMLEEANGFGIMLLPSSTFLGCPGDDRLRITYGRDETRAQLERWRTGLSLPPGDARSLGLAKHHQHQHHTVRPQRQSFERWHTHGGSVRAFCTATAATATTAATTASTTTALFNANAKTTDSAGTKAAVTDAPGHRLVLGIETSCDDTGVAVVDYPSGRIVFEALASQYATHASFQGVVPRLAMRDHELNLPVLLGQAEDALSEFGGFSALGGVAATRGPGLAMCLRVGLKAGRDLAHVHGLPFVGVNHLEAHVLVPRLPGGGRAAVASVAAAELPISPKEEEDKEHDEDGEEITETSTATVNSSTDVAGSGTGSLEYPFLVLLVSGGHCMLLLTRGVGDHVRLGSTLDDSLGEAYDKVARMLGLGFGTAQDGGGGGAALERLARGGDETRVPFPIPLQRRRDDCDFSFSGLKTAVVRVCDKMGLLEADGAAGGATNSSFGKKLKDISIEGNAVDGAAGGGISKADIAASFQRSARKHLQQRLGYALARCRNGSHDDNDDDDDDDAALPYPNAVVITGGVAANQYLREHLRSTVQSFDPEMEVVFPPPRLCTDNGVMVAWAGQERIECGMLDDATPPEDGKEDFRARWPLG